MVVSIVGNIGSGKTSLAKKLASYNNWELILDNSSENPYIEDFYHEMRRWSFQLQIYFLYKRYNQILNVLDKDNIIIQDKSLLEDRTIFAPTLNDIGLISSRDFETYCSIFDLISSKIHFENHIVYLRSSVDHLLDNIIKRNRKYELKITKSYLSRLNERYEAWAFNNKTSITIVDADSLNFVENENDFKKIASTVSSKIALN